MGTLLKRPAPIRHALGGLRLIYALAIENFTMPELVDRLHPSPEAMIG